MVTLDYGDLILQAPEDQWFLLVAAAMRSGYVSPEPNQQRVIP